MSHVLATPLLLSGIALVIAATGYALHLAVPFVQALCEALVTVWNIRMTTTAPRRAATPWQPISAERESAPLGVAPAPTESLGAPVRLEQPEGSDVPLSYPEVMQRFLPGASTYVADGKLYREPAEGEVGGSLGTWLAPTDRDDWTSGAVVGAMPIAPGSKLAAPPPGPRIEGEG